MEELIGRTVAGYEIADVIGSGDVATVYKAYRASLELHVALKVLAAHYSHDQVVIERFCRQARATGRLRHPNIVPVHQIGQEDDLHYVAMDYIEGPNLARKLKDEGPLSAEAALAVLTQLGAALDFAHAEGVVHGNLKPTNILFAPDGRAVLTDFSAPDAEGGGGPADGDPPTSPVYASPEQAQGMALDGRSDVYSLGVLLYEMFTGRAPLAGDDRDAILEHHVGEPPPAPSQHNGNIAPPLEQVVLRALQKQPARRYQSAGDLARALARAIGAPRQQRTRSGLYRPSRVPANARLLAGTGLVVLLGFAVVRVLAGHTTPGAAPTSLPAGVTPRPATATPSPSVTASPTPSPTRTAAPTATHTPEPSPTPPPTETLAPPTVPPSRTPVPTVALAAAPVLVEPADGTTAGGSAVTFRWTWDRPLRAGEHFDLRVWREGQAPTGIAWVEDTSFTATGLAGAAYRWSVAVIREAGATPDGSPAWEPVSRESDSRSFSYWPSGGSPAQPPTAVPPTAKPPEPTPLP